MQRTVGLRGGNRHERRARRSYGCGGGRSGHGARNGDAGQGRIIACGIHAIGGRPEVIVQRRLELGHDRRIGNSSASGQRGKHKRERRAFD